MRSPRCLVLIAPLAVLNAFAATPVVHESASERFGVEVVARGFSIAAALCFLPDGSLLVAERRPAALRRVDVSTGAVSTVAGLPAIHASEDAGLHDVVAHPEFARNHQLYFTYSQGTPGDTALVLARGQYADDKLTSVETLFTAEPRAKDDFHFGGRIAFDGDALFLTSGDRHVDASAQDLGSHLGKVLRLDHDGGAAAGNPYRDRANARPEVWSSGFRNPQGLARDPRSGIVWAVEHGPHGGDELNRIERRANYGWPTHTWGFAYEGGLVGRGPVADPAFTAPLHVWSPGRAPSDVVVYDGAAFPRWRGSLFIGAMAGHALLRLVLDDRGALVLEERLLLERRQRVRAIEADAAGLLYVAVDQGELLRLRPAPP